MYCMDEQRGGKTRVAVYYPTIVPSHPLTISHHLTPSHTISHHLTPSRHPTKVVDARGTAVSKSEMSKMARRAAESDEYRAMLQAAA